MPDPLPHLSPLLAGYHTAAALVNLAAAGWSLRRRHWFRAAAWSLLAGLFVALACLAAGGRPAGMPASLKTAIDAALGPVTVTCGWFAAWVIFYLGRRFFVVPAVAWSLLNLAILFLGLSLADRNFAAIVGKPDNIPIVAMVFLLAIFTWVGTAQAVENDRRLAADRQVVEKDFAESVFVWPDVVYLELIGIVIGTTVLIVWSLVLRAPLEAPANPAVTPNPSKAPWYFLGLQEMLVYFAPWKAGVLLPALIIFGLLALPYLDVNPRGSGYYTIAQRRWVYLVFQFGFQLWILLILIGTFLRGPNWSFFGPYEYHDPQKITTTTNISLAEYAWTGALGRAVPQPDPAADPWRHFLQIAWREVFGLAALAVVYLALPWALAWTVLRDVRQQMGRPRYWIAMLLVITMFLVPLKMILCWTLNLNYVVNMPEYSFYW